MTERMFPVLYGYTKAEIESREKGPLSVPWRLLQPHERQALINHDQTLERLAQRGGLSLDEIVAVIRHRRHQRMDEDKAREAVLGYIDELKQIGEAQEKVRAADRIARIVEVPSYSDGLRKAADLLEQEILADRPSNMVELKKPSNELEEVGRIVRQALEAFIKVKAARLRQMADEAEGKTVCT